MEDKIQCSRCRTWFPLYQKVPNYKKCPKCVEIAKREARERARLKRIMDKRRHAEGSWEWSGSGAAIFW